jgi:hypothetical protein
MEAKRFNVVGTPALRNNRKRKVRTLDSPGMIMRLTNVGSQYLMGFTDADKNPFDGAKTTR